MSHKVLIVDDEQSLRILLRDNLEIDGFEVIEAATGREAIDLAWAQSPHIAIIDVGLPDMKGWDVCLKLQGDPRSKNMPLVILTASSSGDVETKKVELGIEHCVLKPYNPMAVSNLVRKILGIECQP